MAIHTITDDHMSISWPLDYFAITNELKSGPATLLLDRANSEFGVMLHNGPGTTVLAKFPDTEEPVYFQVSKARSACSRFNTSCKKVCVLMQNFQLDLLFSTSAHASDFLQVLGRLATKIGNLYFEVYDGPSQAAVAKPDFNMEREGFTNQGVLPWLAMKDTQTSEWARIYKTNKCSDYTVIAGATLFPVHRVLLSTRSEYFNAVCDGRFAETEQRSIMLPEDSKTVSTMLQEMYEVYNPTTGSVFTNFALRRAFEKECVMSDLLALFIACDKYSLESIKQKAAETLIDRLTFIYDPLSIVDLASEIYGDNFPALDRGLRKALIIQVHARLPAIMDDKGAWDEYSGNKTLLKALHVYQCEVLEAATAHGILTPPVSPTKR